VGLEEAEAGVVCRLAAEESVACPVAGTDTCATANSTVKKAQPLNPMAQMYHKNLTVRRGGRQAPSAP
jgi:hypothetical protein